MDHYDVQPKEYLRQGLIGLFQQPHIYADTVDRAAKADRRRKNRAARKSRRINRGR